MGIGVLSAIIRPTEFFSAFVVNFNLIISIGFSCRADVFQMPAQQQAVDVGGNFFVSPKIDKFR
jgi:hypothetical protein